MVATGALAAGAEADAMGAADTLATTFALAGAKGAAGVAGTVDATEAEAAVDAGTARRNVRIAMIASTATAMTAVSPIRITLAFGFFEETRGPDTEMLDI